MNKNVPSLPEWLLIGEALGTRQQNSPRLCEGRGLQDYNYSPQGSTVTPSPPYLHCTLRAPSSLSLLPNFSTSRSKKNQAIVYLELTCQYTTSFSVYTAWRTDARVARSRHIFKSILFIAHRTRNSSPSQRAQF